MSRSSVRITVLLFVMFSFLVPGTGAHAWNAYPQGCDGIVSSYSPDDWRDTCYIGSDGSKYIDYAWLVYGASQWMRGVPGVSDLHGGWTFNGQMYNQVISYQSTRNLYADGIVGPATWGRLEGERQLVSCDTSACYYKTPQYTVAVGARLAADGNWFTRYNNGWNAWDWNGPLI